MNSDNVKRATLYRMVMDQHICPFGLKARDLLERAGFTVDDHHLISKAETEAFKADHGVRTTPQVFIAGQRVGGYDALRKHLGRPIHSADAVTYRPVIAVFGTAALMALAASWAATGALDTVRFGEWFIAFSMCILAILKLRDLEGFSNMFLGYDLLAQRVVRYAYVYPFAEALAGILMIAYALMWIAIPVALFIGGIGAVSVFKVWPVRRQGNDSSDRSEREFATLKSLAHGMREHPAVAVARDGARASRRLAAGDAMKIRLAGEVISVSDADAVRIMQAVVQIAPHEGELSDCPLLGEFL